MGLEHKAEEEYKRWCSACDDNLDIWLYNYSFLSERERRSFLYGTKNNPRQVDLKKGAKLLSQHRFHHRSPQLNYGFSIKPTNGNVLLERFKKFVYVLQKFYRIRHNTEKVRDYERQITNDARFSLEDLDLYVGTMNFFSEQNPKCLDDFITHPMMDEFRWLFVSRDKTTNSDYVNRMTQFKQEKSMPFISSSSGFIHALYESIYKEKSLLPSFIGKLRWFGVNLLLESSLHETGSNMQKAASPNRLEARLNNSAKKVVKNNTDSCIDMQGKHCPATMIYWLDPSVFTWEFYVNEGINPSPFGLAIFFAAKGNPVSRFGKKEQDYLVFEGFPANPQQYERIGKLEKIAKDGPAYLHDFPISHDQLSNQQPLSLPGLVYYLGLTTAQKLGIGKLLINTSHSPRTQKSVTAAIGEIKKIIKYQPKDTDLGAFEAENSIDKTTQRFEYTHFLHKSRIDKNIVETLRRNKAYWSGENFLDTFDPWNWFIGNTYDNWSPELKRKIMQDHDKIDAKYTKRVWEQAQKRRDQGLLPEAHWNLGVGYCKGFEVDVKKECKRLHIS